MTPQIVAGAIVTFSKTDLYPIFEICGRAFTFNVLTGQLVGGVIMWVPAAIIESIGGLLALRQWLRLSRSGRIRRESGQRRRAARRTAGAGAVAEPRCVPPRLSVRLTWACSVPSSTALAGRARNSTCS